MVMAGMFNTGNIPTANGQRKSIRLNPRTFQRAGNPAVHVCLSMNSQ